MWIIFNVNHRLIWCIYELWIKLQEVPFFFVIGNEKKVVHLWELEGAKERLELVEADLSKEGSFDNALIGCEGVFHTASPVIGIQSDPKACIYKYINV